MTEQDHPDRDREQEWGEVAAEEAAEEEAWAVAVVEVAWAVVAVVVVAWVVEEEVVVAWAVAEVRHWGPGATASVRSAGPHSPIAREIPATRGNVPSAGQR